MLRRTRTGKAWRGLSISLAASTAALTLAVIGGSPANACGCGMVLQATPSPNVAEKALVSYHTGTETIIPELNIVSVGAHAAVLFPVPSAPRVSALATNVDIFSELEAVTTPAPQQNSGFSGASAAAPKIVSQKVVGGYQVTVLFGGTGQTLLDWLASHHYHLSKSIQGALQGYVNRHWYYVALRLADRRAGEIKPLEITFQSTQILYPMRLSRFSPDPVSLELFLNTDGPATATGIQGLTRSFAGSVSSVSAQLTRPVRALLPASYLTRYDASGVSPSTIKADISVHAPNVAPAGTAQKRQKTPKVAGMSNVDRVLALLAIFVIGLGVLGVFSAKKGAFKRTGS